MTKLSSNRYFVSRVRNRVTVDGAITQRLSLSESNFFHSLFSVPDQRHCDLMMIAAGAYAIDRSVKRSRSNESGVRTFQITFNVGDHSFWNQLHIRNRIEEILYFLTDDNWTVRFDQASLGICDAGHQAYLPLKLHGGIQRVALYSGGLDSAAGLALRLHHTGHSYSLVTVAHNSRIRKLVREQLAALPIPFRKLTSSIALVAHLSGNVAKRISRQEISQRSRAFLFAATAALVAKHHNIFEIEVFENGVGAVNLPPMTGMLQCGRATRGAHPTFLRLIGELVSEINGLSTRFVLPFLWNTKPEMAAHVQELGLGDWLRLSRSCVHTSIRQEGVTHCGLCPGCLERRTALSYSAIETGPSLDSISTPRSHWEFVRLGHEEARNWIHNTDVARQRLEWHGAITDLSSAGIGTDALIPLHERYAHQWSRAFQQLDAA